MLKTDGRTQVHLSGTHVGHGVVRATKSVADRTLAHTSEKIAAGPQRPGATDSAARARPDQGLSLNCAQSERDEQQRKGKGGAHAGAMDTCCVHLGRIAHDGRPIAQSATSNRAGQPDRPRPVGLSLRADLGSKVLIPHPPPKTAPGASASHVGAYGLEKRLCRRRRPPSCTRTRSRRAACRRRGTRSTCRCTRSCRPSG